MSALTPKRLTLAEVIFSGGVSISQLSTLAAASHSGIRLQRFEGGSIQDRISGRPKLKGGLIGWELAMGTEKMLEMEILKRLGRPMGKA